MNTVINTRIKKRLRDTGVGEDAIDMALSTLRIVIQTGPTCQVFDNEGNHVNSLDIDHTNVEQYQLAFFE